MVESPCFGQKPLSNCFPPARKPRSRAVNACLRRWRSLSKAVDEKAGSPGFTCMLRIVASAENSPRAQLILTYDCRKLHAVQRCTRQQFSRTRYHNSQRLLSALSAARRARRSGKTPLENVLGTAELASFFHFPNIKYNKVQNIKWQNFSNQAGSQNIPEKGLFLDTIPFGGERRRST